MPKTPIDFSNTVIYKIVCNDLNIKDLYVGHTTDFRKRKNVHKKDSKNLNYKVYQFIRDNGNWENWSMILIEKFPCADKLEALQRERFWCEKLNATLNTCLPGRQQKESDKAYYERNKDKVLQHKKEYRQKNRIDISQKGKLYYEAKRDTILSKNKNYYDNNKEKIKQRTGKKYFCDCGGCFTQLNKSAHVKTTKHQDYEKYKFCYIANRGLKLIKQIDNLFK